MKKFIGSKVLVHLKTDDVISGVLVDVDAMSSYVDTSDKIYSILNSNIKYTTMDVSSASKLPEPKTPESHDTKTLKVYVDDNLTATIPVLASVDLSKWNEKIYETALNHSDVHKNLSGKIQKTVEYFPGELYIITESNKINSNRDEFSMSGVSSPLPIVDAVSDDLINNFVDPAQMVERLNKMASKKEQK